MRIHATCAQAVTSAIKAAIGTSTDLVVASKYLTGQGVHCWKGMLGYVTKQHQEDHYQLEKHNVSDAAIQEGHDFYALNAASAGVKGKKPLNPTSVVQVRLLDPCFVQLQRHIPDRCACCSILPASVKLAPPFVMLPFGACWGLCMPL